MLPMCALLPDFVGCKMLHLKFMCFPFSCLPSWKEDDDEDGPSPSQGPSWFRKQYSPKGSGRHIVFIIFSLLLLVKRRLWLYMVCSGLVYFKALLIRVCFCFGFNLHHKFLE